MEAHSGAVEAHPGTLKLPWSNGGSTWSPEGSPWINGGSLWSYGGSPLRLMWQKIAAGTYVLFRKRSKCAKYTFANEKS
jgi:hypothetical protein